MRFINLLLLAYLILFSSCLTQKENIPSRKYYKVYKKGYKVLNSQCSEFKKLIKEGQLRIPKDCNYDCLVHFDKELYWFYKANNQKFIIDECINTKQEIDMLFGFETATVPIGNELSQKRVVISMFHGKSVIDGTIGIASFVMNPNDSIVSSFEPYKK